MTNRELAKRYKVKVRKSKRSYYDPSTDTIYLHGKVDDKRFLAVFAHEMGHRIDWKAGEGKKDWLESSWLIEVRAYRLGLRIAIELGVEPEYLTMMLTTLRAYKRELEMKVAALKEEINQLKRRIK